MATHILWEWGVFILVCEWNTKSQFFQNRVGWRLDLATWLSREFKPRANWVASLNFCPVVLQLAWLFSFPACSARVQLLAACKLRASCEVQPRVPASLHSLESPETQQYTMIIVCRKAWNAYEAGMMWSSKDGVKKQIMAWSNKQSLQGSDHNAHSHSHLEWTLEHTS